MTLLSQNLLSWEEKGPSLHPWGGRGDSDSVGKRSQRGTRRREGAEERTQPSLGGPGMGGQGGRGPDRRARSPSSAPHLRPHVRPENSSVPGAPTRPKPGQGSQAGRLAPRSLTRPVWVWKGPLPRGVLSSQERRLPGALGPCMKSSRVPPHWVT